MKIVILCGGKGIRAFPFTSYLPKPMLPIGGTPVIVHVIRNFINQGYTDFLLAAGYRKDVLEVYFEGKDIGANIEVVDTGENADTGDRILACQKYLEDRFIVTYGDGLSDVPIADLVRFHESHDGAVTVTSAPMYSQYGVLDIDQSGRVDALNEKPLLKNHWINAGFIVFDNSVLKGWAGGNLENDVIPALVHRDLVYSYQHEGFFKSLDSYKDQQEFEEIVKSGTPPWLVNKAKGADHEFLA